MSITLTKFGSGTPFGAGTKFGYTYDSSDLFGAAIKTDVDTILKDIGRGYVVYRETATTDGLEETLAVTEALHSVYGYITDITAKDRLIHEMGLATPGHSKGYFLQKYEVSAGKLSFTLQEGDILQEGNITITKFGAGTSFGVGTKFGYSQRLVRWKIDAIIKETKVSLLENYVPYITVILRNVGLEGSG